MSFDIEGRIFVGGLDHDCDERTLEESFKMFGEVTQVMLIRNHETQQSRGFGFISFKDHDSADDAIARMNGVEIMGRCVTVKRAERQRRSSEDGKSNRFDNRFQNDQSRDREAFNDNHQGSYDNNRSGSYDNRRRNYDDNRHGNYDDNRRANHDDNRRANYDDNRRRNYEDSPVERRSGYEQGQGDYGRSNSRRDRFDNNRRNYDSRVEVYDDNEFMDDYDEVPRNGRGRYNRNAGYSRGGNDRSGGYESRNNYEDRRGRNTGRSRSPISRHVQADSLIRRRNVSPYNGRDVSPVMSIRREFSPRGRRGGNRDFQEDERGGRYGDDDMYQDVSPAPRARSNFNNRGDSPGGYVSRQRNMSPQGGRSPQRGGGRSYSNRGRNFEGRDYQDRGGRGYANQERSGYRGNREASPMDYDDAGGEERYERGNRGRGGYQQQQQDDHHHRRSSDDRIKRTIRREFDAPRSSRRF